MKVRISIGEDELDQLIPGSKLHTQAVLAFSEKRENVDAVEVARDIYGSDDIEIDDDATISAADDGVWVAGWLWVHNENRDIEEKEEEEEENDDVEKDT